MEKDGRAEHTNAASTGTARATTREQRDNERPSRRSSDTQEQVRNGERPLRDIGPLPTACANILLITDDCETARQVRDSLQTDGQTVLVAHNRATALAVTRTVTPDLVVLNLMLPFGDGLQVCREVRQQTNVPVIMLTSRTTDTKHLTGLDIGVDGYITRPFHPRDLASWVRTVLRRLPQESGPLELRCGDLVLDYRRRDAYLGGRPLALTRVEFRLLSVLAAQPGHPVSREYLASQIPGRSGIRSVRTVDAHVHNLRRKVEPDPENARYVKTVYGFGYMFSEAADEDN